MGGSVGIVNLYDTSHTTDRLLGGIITFTLQDIHLVKSASTMPNITLTTPTSAAHPHWASIPEGIGHRSSTDNVFQRQPPTHPTTLKHMHACTHVHTHNHHPHPG